MGLFSSKEEKEEKEQQKLQSALDKYNLSEIDNKYAESVRNIQLGLMGTGMMEAGTFLTGSKTEDNLKIAYLKTLIEQNWIVIRQLDEISKKLGK